MAQRLVVVHPFGKYAKGQHINDASEMDEIVKSGREHFCVRANVPEEKAEMPKGKKA